MKKFITLYAFLFGFVFSSAGAQTPLQCGQEEYLKRAGITREAFEKEFQKLIAKRRLQQPINGWVATSDEVLTVPIVFHILLTENSNGRRPSDEAYIPEQRIKNQVDTLNVHFRHKNKNKSEILPTFRSLAADTKIEFVLAKQDPYGLPTDGILRSGEEIGFIPAEHAESGYWTVNHLIPTWSPLWDPARYLNIYVLPWAIMGGFGGVASFPMGSLDGIATLSNIHGGRGIGLDPETPHIALHEYALPNNPSGLDDFGYILVHEIGHYYALWHSFGDASGCPKAKEAQYASDDFCDDTPFQELPEDGYGNLPCSDITEAHPLSTSCGSLDMIQNYMNYVASDCYRLFSPCQKERMRTILNESYNRKTVTESSLALTAPVAYNTDSLRIIKTEAPTNVCSSTNTFNLSAIVANFGTNALSTYEVGVYLGDTELKKLKVTGENLAKWGRDTLVLEGIARGTNRAKHEQLEIRVTEISGNTIASNHAHISAYRAHKTVYFTSVVAADALPLKETFEATSGKATHWTLSPETDALVRQETRIDGENKALVFPYADMANHESYKGIGYGYTLYSPALKVTQAKANHMLALRVPYSFTSDSRTSMGGMRIQVITKTCTANPIIKTLQTIWGDDMTTSWFNTGTNKPDLADWNTLIIPLQKFISDEPFQVSLTAIPNGGNPLYLDDLEVVHIPESPAKSLYIQREPVFYIDEYKRYSGGAQHEFGNFNNSALPCAKKVYTRRELPSTVFTYTFFLGKNAPGGATPTGNCVDPYSKSVISDWGGPIDAYLDGMTRWTLWYDADAPSEGNQIFVTAVAVNKQTPVTAPVLNDFSDSYGDWVAMPEKPSYDPGYAERWQRSATGNYIKGSFHNSNEHANYLLALPIADLSKQTTTKLYFDVSYAPRTGASTGERLRVVVIEDTDIHKGVVVYNKAGDDLKTANAQAGAWEPTAQSHWRSEEVDLSTYAKKGFIHVIFVASNHGGNNLYLDNIALAGTTKPTTAPKITALREEETIAPNFSEDRNVGKTLDFYAKVSGTGEPKYDLTVQNIGKGNWQYKQGEGAWANVPADGINTLAARDKVRFKPNKDANTYDGVSPKLTLRGWNGNALSAGAVRVIMKIIEIPTYLLGIHSAKEQGVEVHPNPTKEHLVVRLPSHIAPPVSLTLIDAHGRTISTQASHTSASTLEVRLPKGASGAVYFLRIEGQNLSTTRRVIVE